MLQTVWNEIDYRVDVCIITNGAHRAPVRYVTKTGSVVILNKKIHILLSEVYCVWQVVKTPTIISNNPVFVVLYLSQKKNEYSQIQNKRLSFVINSGRSRRAGNFSSGL
jgi:hypothetical protein